MLIIDFKQVFSGDIESHAMSPVSIGRDPSIGQIRIDPHVTAIEIVMFCRRPKLTFVERDRRHPGRPR
jgi:hypothetical protein